jgi:Tol biopolymer transport system component
MLRHKLTAIMLVLFATLAVACTGDTQAPTSTAAEADPQAAAIPTDAPTPQPEPTAQPTAAEALPPPPTDDAPAVLPAPLYYIDEGDGQLYRLERDGSSRVQVTYEPDPVDEFAVGTERVAYVTNNTLYLVDLFGAGRTAIAEGAPDAEDFFERLRDLTWHPDGTRLAYYDGGLSIYDVTSGTSELALPSDPVPDFSDEDAPTPNPDEPAVNISPIAWSPDGQRLLIQEAIYFSDGVEVTVYTPQAGALTRLSSPGGLVCCNPTWTPDGQSVIISSDSAGFLTPGMWIIDAETGEGRTLIDGTPTGDVETYTLVFGARELADGFIYRFQTTVEGFPEEQPPLEMVRSLPDESEALTLHPETYIPGVVTWDPAGSGVIILDLTEQYGLQGFPDFPYRGPLVWLPTDGDPVPLGVIGGDPAWGPN